MSKTIKPVVQEEKTGCAIAASAALAGLSYARAKEIANRLGIYAEDSALWSQTHPIRRLLTELGIRTAPDESTFVSWTSLPDCALLATKWRLIKEKPFWHWAVFVREGQHSYVLDSSKTLKTHIRTDLGRIEPRWYIEIIR
ncbi:MAG: hypothetical protein SVU69_01030 [Pseudomonadota bacterium]|nr:hypothetical protein [Pseudomonadota bacterium]